ncbi:cdkn1a interacting zinc finger protein 1a [Periophthalmus magnuspinnatus]|uniref:cdkn1a interacting zinc finger protein 1a n=1 Tax=Periophthalmus magnuspinnatus TaxID=409849 RepID=UPI00145B6E44|nr:cdkn1a interacting zinc finger protein 1a [Periophthalmus magnuspinnatus]XP_055087715.1 cdkn1a interacting zinc finger protein 1a [Periophthalmus magnuspinnatus]
MFNPHIHHHQQQQQQQQQHQFHQHLRQLQQLFQHQQPPPPPPPQPSAAHHVPHPPRAIPVPPQPAPPPRMVNLCQTTQTTIIAPNPMLQGALLMQQMQGNMRGFGMGGQQFRQFFAAGARSSLLGPVPMGVAIKSPMMGFPPARPVYPPVRYYNNNSSAVPGSSAASSSATDVVARQSEKKRDIEQVTQDLTEDQPGPSTATEANEAGHTANPIEDDGCCIISEEQLEEPVIKKQKTQGFEVTREQPVVCAAEADCEILSSDSSHPEEMGSNVDSEVLESENEIPAAEARGSLAVTEVQHVDMPMVEVPQEEDGLLPGESHEEGEEDVDEGNNKFYCYLCSITCHNQQNFRSHMNSISHQQRMMEIQHMSNACLVTLLPRLQDSLQGTTKDGEKKNELKRWCVTCQTHFTSSVLEHRQTKEHKVARKMTICSCTICKKNFRSSQMFIQHLQTIEHRKKVEMVQENEGCEEPTKIPDGFLVEEEGAMSEDDENMNQSNAEDQDDLDKQDGGASKEVTLEDADDSVQYDPEVLYGGRFFVPVAGFICRLCNKFYHFESPDLHLHCKSLEHFENLKRYKTDQKYAASRKCVAEEESNTCSSEPTSETSSKQPVISVCRLQMQTNKETIESNETLQDVTISTPSASSSGLENADIEEAATSPTVGREDSSETVPEVTTETAPSVSNEGDVDEQKAVVGKKKAKTTTAPRRRTVRATNRR